MDVSRQIEVNETLLFVVSLWPKWDPTDELRKLFKTEFGVWNQEWVREAASEYRMVNNSTPNLGKIMEIVKRRANGEHEEAPEDRMREIMHERSRERVAEYEEGVRAAREYCERHAERAIALRDSTVGKHGADLRVMRSIREWPDFFVRWVAHFISEEARHGCAQDRRPVDQGTGGNTRVVDEGVPGLPSAEAPGGEVEAGERRAQIAALLEGPAPAELFDDLAGAEDLL